MLPGTVQADQTRPIHVTDPEALRSDQALQEDWYYTIELAPGLFTTGMEFESIVLTREILRRCEIRGRRCLDIGAMDGLVSLLLARRGADRVVAYDRSCFRNRIDLLRRAHGVGFDYVSGVRLRELRPIVRALGAHPFDVVVFSGVLYHVFDPLGTLLTVRGMVRTGGVLIVETAAVVQSETAMYFNDEGRFYLSANYWKPAVPCLDYLLRLARLRPIDCVFHRQHRDRKNGELELVRIAVACRAVEAAVSEGHDRWMHETNGGVHDLDFTEFLDWTELHAVAAPVEYEAPQDALVLRPGTRSVDLLASVHTLPELRVTNRAQQIALPIDAMY